MPEKESQFLKPEIDKEKSPEILKARQEGERIYSEEFAGRLNEVLGHEFKVKDKDGQEQRVILKDIVDKHLKGFYSLEFVNLSAQERATKQREFVMDLGRAINKIPGGDPWSFYPKRIMEKDKINCSGSSALLGMVLENTKEKSGIKSVEHGFLFGHVVNMITFGDGRLYFADVRNGTFKDVSDYTQIDEKNNLKIYKINWPKIKTGYVIPYQSILVTGIKEGAIGSYAENLGSAWDAARGQFDRALKMGHSDKELKKIQEGAEEVCRENNLSSSKELDQLREIKKIFSGKISGYWKSKEYKEEMKRIERPMK